MLWFNLFKTLFIIFLLRFDVKCLPVAAARPISLTPAFLSRSTLCFTPLCHAVSAIYVFSGPCKFCGLLCYRLCALKLHTPYIHKLFLYFIILISVFTFLFLKSLGLLSNYVGCSLAITLEWSTRLPWLCCGLVLSTLLACPDLKSVPDRI